MSRIHARGNPVSSGIVNKFDKNVVSQYTVYGNEEGILLSGYLGMLSEILKKAPGIVLIHE